MRVVICGGGVIGACTAYFLSRRGIEVAVVEREGVAACASGKSGGFLALDWCDGSPLAPLARRSFALHAELAAAHDGERRWGYRRLDTLAVLASARRRPGRGAGARLPDWLAPDVALHGRLGTTASTAQVDPAAFTRAMMELARDAGAEVRIGNVTGLVRSADGGRVTGVESDDDTLEADAVVVAMGPWSVLACRWLPLPAVHGLKGHSLVFRNPGPVSAHALFAECEAADGEVLTPEVYPRPDGTTYVCGLSSEAPLPLDPADVTTDPGAAERLHAALRSLAPELAEGEVLASQACYRPIVRDGLPLMGAIAGTDGAYVATGHSVWGMLNAPATGEAMAELITEGAAQTVDIGAFDPARLPPLPPDALRL